MRSKAVYFSTGEIIEYGGSRRRLKRIIQMHKRLTDEPVRYWFRPTEAWRQASEQSLERWRRTHRTPWSRGAGRVITL